MQHLPREHRALWGLTRIASMIEERVTTGCKPEHSFCFLGEVTGNHGLRGTTCFKADGVAPRPTTSPDFLPYSGLFEYHTDAGSLITRETGVSNTTQGRTESGAVAAFQKIIESCSLSSEPKRRYLPGNCARVSYLRCSSRRLREGAIP